MKKFFFLLLVGLTTHTFSQGRDEQYTPKFSKEAITPAIIFSSNKLHEISKSKRLFRSGVFALGGGLLVAGGGWFLIRDSYNQTELLAQGFEFFFGSVITAFGAGGTIAGGVLMISGGVKKHQAKKLTVSALLNGIKIAYTF